MLLRFGRLYFGCSEDSEHAESRSMLDLLWALLTAMILTMFQNYQILHIPLSYYDDEIEKLRWKRASLLQLQRCSVH